jgi:vanillate O-demethylase monooxygenase subunit
MVARREVRVIPGDADYPRNQWYVAAFSHEVERGKLLHRTLLDEPVVLYRDRDGKPVALFDRCPHRGMPLSMGKLIGEDTLQCLYHGFEYDTQGRCTLIPSQDAVPQKMAVRRFPTVELWQWIWIWVGDPALADPALIPDHHAIGLTRPDWHTATGILLRVEANYLLPFENLVDATHISYLHHGMIDDGNVARKEYRIEEDRHIVRVIREFKNELQGSMSVEQGRVKEGQRLDRTLLLEAQAPQTFFVSMTFVPSDAPDTPPKTNRLIVMLTPESPRATLQFTADAQTFPLGDLEKRRAGVRKLLSEDVVAIEAIQKLQDRIGVERCPEYSQKADAGALRTRKIIHDMIVAERAGRRADAAE